MTERGPLQYWNDERPLGPVHLGGSDWLLHARSHVAAERYSRRTTSEVQLFDLSPTGTCTWVQSRFFIHAPEDSVHEIPIGQAQAHYYPANRLVTIWELFTEERYRPHDDPREDLLLRGLWLRYERFLTDRFSDARCIGALWEPEYDAEHWTGFMTTLGYRRTAPSVYLKMLGTPQHRATDG